MGKGMDALLGSPAVVRMAAASMGLMAARLDYHEPTKTLRLSVLRSHDRVHKIDLPIGRTFSREEICELLMAPSSSAPERAGSPEVCTAGCGPPG